MPYFKTPRAATPPPPTPPPGGGTTTTTTTTTSPAAPAAGASGWTSRVKGSAAQLKDNPFFWVVLLSLVGFILWLAISHAYDESQHHNGVNYAVAYGLRFFAIVAILLVVYKFASSFVVRPDVADDASDDKKEEAEKKAKLERASRRKTGWGFLAVAFVLYLIAGIITVTTHSSHINGDKTRLQTIKNEGGTAYLRIEYLATPGNATTANQANAAKVYTKTDKSAYTQLEHATVAELNKANAWSTQLKIDRNKVEQLGKA